MPSIKTNQGVSRSVRVATAGRSRPQNQTLGQKALARKRRQEQAQYELNLRGLTAESQRVIAELRGENSETGAFHDNNLDAGAMDIEWETVPNDLNDNDTFAHAVRDIFNRKYKDTRTWKHRHHAFQENWAHLIEALASAFLSWKYPATNTSPNDSSATATPTASAPTASATPTTETSTAPAPTPPTTPIPTSPTTPADSTTSSWNFTIPVVDIYTLESEVLILRSVHCKSIAEALVLNGYLSASPENPTLAVSLRTLELYGRIRVRKPSFSVEAFAKVICDLYGITYRRRYWHALLDTFHVYLAIQRSIDKQICRALGRDSPDWRVLNACPPCSYELEDEPDMKFHRMLVMDGNSSLKRVAAIGERTASDTRIFEDSDYYLSQTFVDQFAGEVSAAKGDNDGQQHNEDPGGEVPNDDHDDNEDSKGVGDGCHASKWKAAGEKGTWGIFEESGIFASACRHGLILWIMDMIRSGELAKYPLAIVSKALKVLAGHDIFGYDIGCSFCSTVSTSSLGPSFQESGSRFCVNAFHGYAHNYCCQLKNHPNFIDGVGLEDLETLERVFSASNHVAPLTRYVSAYNRRVLIDLFFRNWDNDKYQNLGTMIYNNYVQALDIVENESIALAAAKTSLQIEDEDLERWQAEELEYFQTLGQEPEYDAHAVAYVELLQKLRDVNSQYEKIVISFLDSTPDNYEFNYTKAASQTRKIETDRRHLSEKRDNILREVIEMEVKMDITRRWQPGDHEYLETMKYIQMHHYYRALDKLRRLVLQHLFELHKLNLSQTGYKARTHIAKALQKRCTAIQNAVKAYNTAATSLNPPRATVDWSKVSSSNFLEEFDFLRDPREQIHSKKWAEPIIRTVMRQAQRISQARTEIIRCNVELRRLHTAIVNEERHFSNVLNQLKANGEKVYYPVLDYCTRRRRVNDQLLDRIRQTFALKGFTGDTTLGVRKGTAPIINCVLPTPAATPRQEETESDEEDADGLSDDDELAGDVDRVIDYVDAA